MLEIFLVSRCRYNVVPHQVRLPLSLGIGDWVYFRCMGAYTLAAGSTFNGMPRPGTVHMCGEMAARRLTRGR